ncbi:MAG: tyrosine-type recombinase/integrase [Eubacteriales bacterium]|nr:tyrosine-type recombinase/integrase [Eubacteriales bacterium]
MAQNNVYLKHQDKENEKKIDTLLSSLPSYCRTFTDALETQHTSSRTRLAYCQDLTMFFRFLCENNPSLSDNPLKISTSDLEMLKSVDIEEYLIYIKYGWYNPENKGIKYEVNDIAALQRRLASLKSFFNYCYTHEIISNNPTAIISLPKLKPKDIIYLEPDEIAKLVDAVESGEGLTAREQKFHELVKCRDLAIIILLLGTGIRVSECVALDINDIDLKNTSMLVHRKEQKVMTLFYSDEVAEYLKAYMDMRKDIAAREGSETALFLSLQNSRMSVRSIERRVKKYSEQATFLKHISPHKLRASFATDFYRETNDIYALSNILGHNSVDVVKKYANIGSETRRRYRNSVRIREE